MSHTIGALQNAEPKPMYLHAGNHNQQSNFDYLDWSQLCAAAESPTSLAKAESACFAPHDAPAKTKAEVVAHNNFTMLWADIDGGNLALADVVNTLQKQGLGSFLIYATNSYTKEAKRWRVCVELSCGIHYTRWSELQGYLSHVLQGDSCTARPQQIAYMPNRGPGDYNHQIEPGTALNPLVESHPFVANGLAFRREQEAEVAALEASKPPAAPRKKLSQTAGQIRPIDAYNEAHLMQDLLAQYGYKQRGLKWLYPDSNSAPGVVVLKDGRYFSHHTSDPLSDGLSHDCFDLFKQREHGGNEKAAIKAVAAELKTPEGISISLHNQRLHMAAQDTTHNGAELAKGLMAVKSSVVDSRAPQLVPLNVRNMLHTDAPPRVFLFTERDRVGGEIKEGIGAGLAAPGGTGKSTVLLEMGYALAMGGTWLGHYDATGPRKVFFFTSEDDKDEIHHRIKQLHREYLGEHFPSTERAAEIEQQLDENLYVFCIMGLEFVLTETNGDGGYKRGPAADHIVSIVNEYGGNGVVILDPLRKMVAGNEEGAAMTAVIHACDWIREQADGTVTTFISHHSSQTSKTQSDDSSAAFRGATDLVDGLRWTMVMHTLRADEAKDFGIPDEDRTDYRKYSFPKSNYAAQQYGLFLRYQRGTFRYEKLVSTKAASAEERTENALPVLCRVLASLEGLGEPVSAGVIKQRCKAKPDQGEVGSMIRIAKNRESVRTLLLEAKQEGLVEQYEAEFANNKKGEAWRLTAEGKKNSQSGGNLEEFLQ